MRHPFESIPPAVRARLCFPLLIAALPGQRKVQRHEFVRSMIHRRLYRLSLRPS
jgi:hypothetical protein